MPATTRTCNSRLYVSDLRTELTFSISALTLNHKRICRTLAQLSDQKVWSSRDLNPGQEAATLPLCLAANPKALYFHFRHCFPSDREKRLDLSR